jgi:hypothetical protein
MPNATVHITLAPQAQLDFSVDGQNAVTSAFYVLRGQANVQMLQCVAGNFAATAFFDTASDFTIDTQYDDNGTGSLSGTLDQTGATVEIEIDSTSFTVPDGAWTMTFS